jgi:hypothetical protein
MNLMVMLLSQFSNYDNYGKRPLDLAQGIFMHRCMKSKILQMLFFIMMITAGLIPATGQSPDAWIFTPPPGAVRSLDGATITYTFGDEKFVLLPPFDAEGRSFASAADEFVKQAFADTPVKIASRVEAGDGRFILITAVAGDRAFAFFFEKSPEGVGLATYMTNIKAFNKAAMDRLVTARLRGGGEMSASAEAGQTLEPTQVRTPALANANWPKGGLIPTTRSEIDWQKALDMGLNLHNNILPVTYDCFQSGSARAVNPNADGILKVQSAGTYSYQSDQVSGGGTWNADPERTYAAYQFTGVLRGEGHKSASIVQKNSHGQFFEINERNADEDVKDRRLTCFPQGPSAEAARIQMARGLLGQETMQCRLEDGSELTVQFGSDRYSSAQGGGTYKEFLVSRNVGQWKGGFEFTSGPFNDAVGYLTEDENGNRSMSVAIYRTIRAYLTSVNETDAVASCFGKAVAKPLPIYGPSSVPATGMTGGLSGVYTVNGSRQVNNFLSVQTLDLYTFTPNGWYYSGAPEGRPVDCSKTKPSGEPICERYEISGGRIRMQNEPGIWKDDDWEPLVRNGARFSIDDNQYAPLRPLNGLKLSGTYKMNSSFSSGTITGVLSTSISEGTMIFTSGGGFRSSKSNWSRVGIGVGTVGAPSAITGSTSKFGENEFSGQYRIENNWLIVRQPDGSEARQFIYIDDVVLKPGQAPDTIYMDDEAYRRE